MFKSVFLIVLITLSTCIFGQETIFLDSILKVNNVKKITQKTILNEENYSDTSYVVYEYNKSGQLIAETYPAGTFNYIKFFYQDDLLQKLIVLELPPDTLSEKLGEMYKQNILEYPVCSFTDTSLVEHFEYDTLNRIRKEQVHFRIGNDYNLYYHYNSLGHKTRITREEMGWMGDSIVRVFVEQAFEYDPKNGRLIEQFYYDPEPGKENERPIYPIKTLTYNYKKGRLYELRMVDQKYLKVLVYNKYGLTILKRTYLKNQKPNKKNLLSLTQFTYNEKYLPIEIKTKDYHKDLNCTVTFIYEMYEK